MDFFDHQAAAKKKTGLLVFLFAAAVVGIIVLVYLAAALIFMYAGRDGAEPVSLWNARLLAMVVVGVLLVVGMGSFFKIAQLGGGGSSVAEMLGGRLLNADTRDAHERKLLNVVEEMAIASGTPVPPVYVMEQESGINAFAAGYSPSDAVIGVTRGCMEKLNRDELQGVIAHEFSHILNGDMRLNIRLIGILHGILIVGLIGFHVMRAMAYSGRSYRRSSNSKGGGATVAILAFGAALMVIGFVGMFFGSLIKAAVSRQREYLADASAVQFTRNPGGIGGALKKIGGFAHGSRLESAKAQEVSHMLFGQGFKAGFASLFATHPPLADRVRRIEPNWDGQFPHVSETQEAFAQALGVSVSAEAAAGFAGGGATGGGGGAGGRTGGGARDSAFDFIGRPSPAHLAYAKQLVETMPAAIRNAAHEAYGARAVIYTMLLNDDAEAHQSQMQTLRQHEEAPVVELTERLKPAIAELRDEARLPVIDMAIGSLREMAAKQYEPFRAIVIELIKADRKVDLFEWVLQRVVLHHLDRVFGLRQKRASHHYSLARLGPRCAVLLSALAYVGHSDKAEAERAFGAGAAKLGDLAGLALAAPGTCGLRELNDALDALEAVAMPLRKQLLSAGAACIAADRAITVAEGELFRAVADALDCPVPPLLPGQPLTHP